MLIHGINGFLSQLLLLVAKHCGAKVFVLAIEPAEMSLSEDGFQISAGCIIRGGSPTERFDSIVTCNISKTSLYILRFLEPCGSSVHVPRSLKDAEVGSNHRFRLPLNIALHTCNTEAVLQAKPQKKTELFRWASRLMSITDLPFAELLLTISNITQVTKKIGLVDLDIHDSKIILATLKDFVKTVDELSESNPNLDLAAAFVIAGGLGDLGRRILLQLARNSSKHLVTLSCRSQNEADYV